MNILLAVIVVLLVLLIIGIIVHASRNDKQQSAEFENFKIVTNRIVAGIGRASDYHARSRYRQLHVLENNIQNTQTAREIANDYHTALTLATDIDTTAEIVATIAQFVNVIPTHYHVEFRHDLITNMNKSNVEAATARINKSLEVSDNKVDAVATAIESAAVTRVDSQNVHDTNVNNNLRNTIKLLQSSAGNYNINDSYNEVFNYVSGKGSDNAKNIARIMNNDHIIHTYGVSEKDILTLVWERTKHQDNANVSDNLKESLLNALDDAVEYGEPTCANGRSARVLASGVTIDNNQEIGRVAATQDIRREIFNEVKNLFDEKINTAYMSDSDSDLKTLASVYLGHIDSVINPETERKLHEELSTDIRNIINKYPTLTPADAKRTEEELKIYLGIEN